jgi:hypothetical protein
MCAGTLLASKTKVPVWGLLNLAEAVSENGLVVPWKALQQYGLPCSIFLNLHYKVFTQ